MSFPPFILKDLSHTIDANCPNWEGVCGFTLKIHSDYSKTFCTQGIQMLTSIGTHIDAPSHLFQGEKCVDEILLKDLLFPLHVIDVTEKVHADYEITVEDILSYEKEYGPISAKSLVVGYTGWYRFWNDPVKYRNLDSNGRMHFPAFSKESALLLLTRDIMAIGIDTLSPDCADDAFSVHHLFLSQGKSIIENIAYLQDIPKRGAYALALPLKVKGATEAPIRLIAISY